MTYSELIAKVAADLPPEKGYTVDVHMRYTPAFTNGEPGRRTLRWIIGLGVGMTVEAYSAEGAYTAFRAALLPLTQAQPSADSSQVDI